MKLATALAERADLIKKIKELSSRLQNNSKVQEGDTPAENPMDLIAELDEKIERLEELIARINLTNSKVCVDGKTITELLAKRDCLSEKVDVMKHFLETSSRKVDRYSNKEIRILSTVPVAEIQKQVDKLSKELRELDEKIQEINWTSELQ